MADKLKTDGAGEPDEPIEVVVQEEEEAEAEATVLMDDNKISPECSFLPNEVKPVDEEGPEVKENCIASEVQHTLSSEKSADDIAPVADLLLSSSSPKALADDLDDEEEFEIVEAKDLPKVEEISAFDLELQKVGAQVIFPLSSGSSPDQWTNLRWLAYARDVRFCDVCTQLYITKKKWFGGNDAETYHTRKLAIYKEPNLILILRPPVDAKEVQTILDLDNDHVDPTRYLVAETVIDPLTCKLRLSPLTTPTSIESTAGGDTASPQRQTCFELVTPTETVLLSALRPKEEKAVLKNSVGFLETKSMEVAVGNALFAAHCPEDRHASSDIAWKHQLVLGSLTSFVISGSQTQLDKALSAVMAKSGSNTVPTHVVDQLDESGRTALHYACARRNSAAVTALIGAGANASIPIPSEGGEILPIHLSALTLDHMSLSTILSAPRRPDPNALDSQGRTAMYLAVTEGVNSDPMAISKCLSALAAWGGEMKSPINPVTILASKWNHASLAAVLAHEGYRYPLKSGAMSLAALYSYPLHWAIFTLRQKIHAIGEAKSDHGFGGSTDTLKSQLRGTLQVLLEHGFEPNERMEQASGSSDMAHHFGCTPLQMLAAAALDAEQLSKSGVRVSTSVFSSVARTLAGAADVLLQCGARLNMDAPPAERPHRTMVPGALDDSPRSLPDLNRSHLKIEGNKDLIDLLGGKERLDACRKVWLEDRPVEATEKTMFRQDKNLAESDAPGGNSEKSCAICWRAFGAIMNRRHKCRVSLKYVCDECSSKRVIEGGKEHRVSDGQFLLARADVGRQKTEKLLTQQEDVKRRNEQMEQVRRKRLEQEKAEEQQRDSLFGNIMEKATSLLGGDEDDKDDVVNLKDNLGQTRDALNQRGERLSALSEKTEKLMNASEGFAKMAKELEESQKGLFW